MHESVADAFKQQFAAGAAKLVLGDPASEKTDLGPLIDDGAAARTAQWVSEAVSAGAKSLVCSPLETAAIRSAVGADPIIITPGVRPLTEVGSDDQKRTMTPSDAIAQGANYVVIGRPITSAWSQGPQALRDKAAAIASEILSN